MQPEEATTKNPAGGAAAPQKAGAPKAAPPKGPAPGQPSAAGAKPAVDVRYINPFIQSTYDLFSTMLGCHAKRGDIGLSSGESSNREITALIGLSGPIRGVVALSFPILTALQIACKLLGKETPVVDDSVSDAVAECVNIITGSAKARMNQDSTPIDLSLPTVIRGKGYNVDYPKQSLWLEVPFTSELGSFSLRVTIAYDGRKAGSTS